MKKNILLLISLLFNTTVYSQIGIGTTIPSSATILEINSKEKGILIPRVTTKQRTKLLLPANGLLVFDTDEQKLMFYDGGNSQWTVINTWQQEGKDQVIDPNQPITFTENSNVGIGTNQPKSKLSVAGNLTIGENFAKDSIAPENGLLIEGKAIFDGSIKINNTRTINKINIVGHKQILLTPDTTNININKGFLIIKNDNHISGTTNILIPTNIPIDGQTLIIQNHDWDIVELNNFKIYKDNVIKFIALNGKWIAVGFRQLAKTGMIIPFAGDINHIPKGYFLCDGRTLNRQQYPELFNAIGTAWGTNSSDVFNIPDLCGLFLRGVDHQANRDPNKVTRTLINEGGNKGNKVGSFQYDIFASHNHGGGNHRHNYYGISGAENGNWGTLRRLVGGTGYSYHTSYSGGIIKTQGGSETRPKNAYVNYIIKY